VARPSFFRDRTDAGQQLAAALLEHSAPTVDAIVCGIPRGGIVVAAEVARALDRPLYAVVARKVGAPGHAELAIGAVGPDGVAVLEDTIVRHLGATQAWIDGAVEQARGEVNARLADLPAVADAARVHGREVIVVDDGVATGSTATAIGRWLEHAGARRRVLALPTGPPDTLERLRSDYDDVFALLSPVGFVAVGQWYDDFTQTTDDEVRRLLSR